MRENLKILERSRVARLTHLLNATFLHFMSDFLLTVGGCFKWSVWVRVLCGKRRFSQEEGDPELILSCRLLK